VEADSEKPMAIRPSDCSVESRSGICRLPRSTPRVSPVRLVLWSRRIEKTLSGVSWT
jgi:hypothetical protein